VVDAAIRALAPQAVRPANESPAPADRPEQDESRTVGYGVGLLKIADLERQRHRTAEAEAFYSKAAAILGDRAEAAPAWLYLGSHEKNPEEGIEYLRKAERLDPAQASKARIWMALARERQQRHKEAEALFKSALSAAKPGSADAGSAAHLYARFLEQQARGGEAKAVEKQAETSRQTAAWRPGVYRVGDGVKAPALLSKVEPEYSEEARKATYRRKVLPYAEIGTDGRAHILRVLRGLG